MPPLNQQSIDRKPSTPTETFLWDESLPGFGVRIYPSGRKTFVVQFRCAAASGRQVRRTIGAVGKITLKNARATARKLLATDVASQETDQRASKQSGTTLGELYELWLQNASSRHRKTGAMRSRASIHNDQVRMTIHVLPRLGSRPLHKIRKTDIEVLRDSVSQKALLKQRKGKGYRGSIGGEQAAKRTVTTLKSVLGYGVDCGLIDFNVASGVRVAPDRPRQVFLCEDQFRELFKSIQMARSEGSAASCDILLLLCLTGCRKSEIEALRWSHIAPDGASIRTGTKTGTRDVHLSPAARTVISRQIKTQSPFVFPAKGIPGSHHQGTKKVWAKIRASSGFEHVRIHDLRHSFASLLAKQGVSLQLIGRALGHRRTQTTLRYAHLTEHDVKQAVHEAAARLDQ